MSGRMNGPRTLPGAANTLMTHQRDCAALKQPADGHGSHRIELGRGIVEQPQEYTLHKWGLNATPNCPHCNAAQQDTDHLVLNCPVTKLDGGYTVTKLDGGYTVTKLDGGYTTVDECGEVLSAWIDRHGLEM